MKDKYFGDVHDFLKFSLLRLLQKQMGWSIFINWMLTTYEPSQENKKKKQNDGEKLNYEKLKGIDEDVYNALLPFRDGSKNRKISAFKTLNLLDNFSESNEYAISVPDGTSGKNLSKNREQWGKCFLCNSKGYNLVFFDPDNGLEVKSTAMGKNNSYKYVFKNEISKIIERGQNVLIYQHRNRQQYDQQLKEKREQILGIAPCSHITVFNGKGTFFLLITSGDKLNDLQVLATADGFFLLITSGDKLNDLQDSWNKQVSEL